MKNLMNNRNKKRQLEFNTGVYTRINIPRIDRTGIDRRSLPCKVIDILDGGLYRLGCAHGILRTCYQTTNMEGINAEFPELDNVPDNQISLTEAARMQRSATVQEVMCCCRSNCSSNRCHCVRLYCQATTIG